MTLTCLVRGSINVDEFFHLPHIVKPGETISSTSLSRRAGGKGANQACAVARSGGAVKLVGAVGQDGVWVKDLLKSYGVGVEGVAIEREEVTGRAIIQLDAEGENCIILHAGTNHSPLPLPSALPASTSYLLLQNEIPLAQTLHYLSLAAASNVSAVFNPSPMLSSSEIASFPWHQLGWIAINEGEMQDLLANLGPSTSGEESLAANVEATGEHLGPFESAERRTQVEDELIPSLLKLSAHSSLNPPQGSSAPPPSIILTLGSSGSVALLPSNASRKAYWSVFTPSAKLRGSTRDTTGAGDCFTGFFVGSLMKAVRGIGKGEEEDEVVVKALRVATQAAGMCCERHGAQEAVPTMEEVEARMAESA